GIQEVLDSGRWESPEDLGEVFIRWGGYAYGQGIYGVEAQEDFRRVLSRVEVTVKNMDTREMDIFSTDDFNAYHGGLNAAVLAASGKRPASYTGDSSNPKAPKVRTTAEEARFIFRVRVLNPRWIEGMKRHGYKGAGDLSRLVDICFQWDATSKVLEDWMYQALAETYALDADMKRFFEEHNPHALLNITERLLEAAKRGLWKRPDQETLERLTDLFLEMEARVE
ncbi:MAG: magnesium chelatase subunit H, partial [Thermodesulfobacteria bacterium]|nr:magnesium chelatase subunit H [Thermodesulfobacteriota bacterium]